MTDSTRSDGPGSTPDLLVIGGGVIGLAAALECARSGLEVELLERAEPGREATWATAGMLSPLAEASAPGPFLDFALESLDLYPGWVREVETRSGIQVEYRECGKLIVALSEDDEAGIARRVTLAGEHGIAVESIGTVDVRALDPNLGPAVRSGLLIPGDFRVDGRLAGKALFVACQRVGVVVHSHEAAEAIEWSGTRVRGVRLTDGTVIEARNVLIAAGAWSGNLRGLPGPLPVRPVRGQMVAVAGSAPLVRSIEGTGVYLTPRDDGRVLIGATVEEVGFEKENTKEGVEQLLAAAGAVRPDLLGATVVETWAGLRPGTPDDLPVLGWWPETEGLLVATGHFRNGILLAPATATAVAALLRNGRDVPVPAAFSPERFRE